LQGLFASTHPLRVPGLNWKQRALHLASIFYYLGSVSNLLTLILPLFFLFGGVLIMKMTLLEMIFYRLPFTTGYYLLYSWLTLRTRSALWSEFYDAFLAPTMGLTVLRSLLNPFGGGFRVTNKANRTHEVTPQWRVARPFIVLLVLHVLGIACALYTQKHIEQRDVFWIVLFFTASNISLLWMCLLVSMDVPHTASFRRFDRALGFELVWENGRGSGYTMALSDREVFVSSGLLPPALPERAQLSIPALGFAQVPVRIFVERCENRVQLVLPELPLPLYRTLIVELYCQPGQWETQPKSEARAAYEYFRASLRMYPLAEAT